MKSSLYYSVDRVKLKGNPYVYYVGFSELELKTGFLIELFDAWKKGGKQTGPVSDMLKAHGLDCVGANFAVDLTRRFLKSGFPIYRPQEQEDPDLSWSNCQTHSIVSFRIPGRLHLFHTCLFGFHYCLLLSHYGLFWFHSCQF